LHQAGAVLDAGVAQALHGRVDLGVGRSTAPETLAALGARTTQAKAGIARIRISARGQIITGENALKKRLKKI